jgi:hypothetical protein
LAWIGQRGFGGSFVLEAHDRSFCGSFPWHIPVVALPLAECERQVGHSGCHEELKFHFLFAEEPRLPEAKLYESSDSVLDDDSLAIDFEKASRALLASSSLIGLGDISDDDRARVGTRTL